MTESVVIAGSLAQKPTHGGHSWVFLQYLLGFTRLGWGVLFLDRLEREMCIDGAGRLCSLDESSNLRYFVAVMERFGLGSEFALLGDRGGCTIGLSRVEV